MNSELFNLWLFAGMIVKVSLMVAIGPGIVIAVVAEKYFRTCEVCHKETPVCDCDLAWLESRALLQENHERWRMETRLEQREQMERARAA